MTTLQTVFAKAKADDRAALIGYLQLLTKDLGEAYERIIRARKQTSARPPASAVS